MNKFLDEMKSLINETSSKSTDKLIILLSSLDSTIQREKLNELESFDLTWDKDADIFVPCLSLKFRNETEVIKNLDEELNHLSEKYGVKFNYQEQDKSNVEIIDFIKNDPFEHMNSSTFIKTETS